MSAMTIRGLSNDVVADSTVRPDISDGEKM